MPSSAAISGKSLLIGLVMRETLQERGHHVRVLDDAREWSREKRERSLRVLSPTDGRAKKGRKICPALVQHCHRPFYFQDAAGPDELVNPCPGSAATRYPYCRR